MCWRKWWVALRGKPGARVAGELHLLAATTRKIVSACRHVPCVLYKRACLVLKRALQEVNVHISMGFPCAPA